MSCCAIRRPTWWTCACAFSWPNRAGVRRPDPALLARRFKHCQLGRTHRDQLVACIARRLTEGNFSEQFKDQLRLALLLDRQAILAAAAAAGCAHRRAYVRQYALWVLAHAP